jgi:hypothetical protein
MGVRCGGASLALQEFDHPLKAAGIYSNLQSKQNKQTIDSNSPNCPKIATTASE